MSIAAIRNAVVRFVAIPVEIAARARETMRDEFGHDLHVQHVAEPCRVCLRIPHEPEPMVLISYRPMPDSGPYAEVGPIFIHAGDCGRYSDEASFPAAFAARPLVVRAYSHGGEIVDAIVAPPGEGENAVRRFLDDPAVAEVHVRHTSYTCFDFKALRA